MAAEEWEIQRPGGKFWERQIFRVGRRELREEVGVKKACCEGGRRQIVPEDSRNV